MIDNIDTPIPNPMPYEKFSHEDENFWYYESIKGGYGRAVSKHYFWKTVKDQIDLSAGIEGEN